jgi:hypothetical protein
LEVFIPTTPLPLSVPVQGQQLTPMQKHLWWCDLANKVVLPPVISCSFFIHSFILL